MSFRPAASAARHCPPSWEHGAIPGGMGRFRSDWLRWDMDFVCFLLVNMCVQPSGLKRKRLRPTDLDQYINIVYLQLSPSLYIYKLHYKHDFKHANKESLHLMRTNHFWPSGPLYSGHLFSSPLHLDPFPKGWTTDSHRWHRWMNSILKPSQTGLILILRCPSETKSLGEIKPILVRKPKETPFNVKLWG